jgi:hypothetical protein
MTTPPPPPPVRFDPVPAPPPPPAAVASADTRSASSAASTNDSPARTPLIETRTGELLIGLVFLIAPLSLAAGLPIDIDAAGDTRGPALLAASVYGAFSLVALTYSLCPSARQNTQAFSYGVGLFGVTINFLAIGFPAQAIPIISGTAVIGVLVATAALIRVAHRRRHDRQQPTDQT